MELKKCLVCCKDCLPETVSAKESNRKGSSAGTEQHIPYNQQDGEIRTVKNQLQVVFLLRKMLEIPEDTCCKLLKHFGNPNLWVQCCDSCSVLVEKSRNIFDQIISLQKNYEELRINIKNTIMTSQNYFGSDYKCEAIVRSYVITQDVDCFINTSVKETDGLTQCLQTLNPIIKQSVHQLLAAPNDSGEQCLRRENGPTGNLRKEVTINVEPEKDISLRQNKKDLDGFIKTTVKETEDLNQNRQTLNPIVKLDQLPVVPNHSDKQCLGSKNEPTGNLRRFMETDGLTQCLQTLNPIIKQPVHQLLAIPSHSGEQCLRRENGPTGNLRKEVTIKVESENVISLGENKEGEMLTVKNLKSKMLPKEMPIPGLLESQKQISQESTISNTRTLIMKLRPSKVKKQTNLKPTRTNECPKCYKTFSSSTGLSLHMVTHSKRRPHACDICGKGFKLPQTLKYHRMTHTGEKPYECETCGKLFRMNQMLKLHRLTHTGDKPHECDFCGKLLSTPQSLKHHRMIHTGERPYDCDICGKCFTFKHNLKTHRFTHTGEKPFECGICLKTFSSNQGLKTHCLVHTRGKPLECDFCGKLLSSDHSLKQHRMIHTGEKPFKCDICDETFRLNQELKYHRMTHTGVNPFKCDICGKIFSTNNYLKYHRRIHTGENPLECDICGKRFIVKQALNLHRSTHLEETFECDICGKSFKAKLSLHRHYVSHTKEIL